VYYLSMLNMEAWKSGILLLYTIFTDLSFYEEELRKFV